VLANESCCQLYCGRSADGMGNDRCFQGISRAQQLADQIESCIARCERIHFYAMCDARSGVK
jgi:hypothetical protein